MTPDQILREPPRILSQAQRESYFETGYLLIERLIDQPLLRRLLAVTQEFVERSREIEKGDDTYDIAPGHSARQPRLRRLKTPDNRHSLYWEYACGIIADVAADLVGPNVLFHHSKLNFKWADDAPAANAVRWHQDIQFYPHTNYSPLTIGTYLTDVGLDDGPLAVLPGSHDGPLYDQYGDGGQWTGCLSDRDVAGLDVGTQVVLTGPAGSITVHNCRTVHSSPPARSETARPLLLNAYSSADAFPYMPNPSRSPHDRTVVRGTSVRWAHHDPRPCLIPPDWSEGYTSIYAAQAGEKSEKPAVAM